MRSRIGNPTHGLYHTPENGIWRAMLARCRNPNSTAYHKYGARGIAVCERWHRFENFLADMGERPTPKHSIDRIDVLGNYEPGNCRWATPDEQARNKRRPRNNSSGIAGVTFNKQLGKWRARIGYRGKSVYLGDFAHQADAIAARKKKAAELEFATGHGERL